MSDSGIRGTASGQAAHVHGHDHPHAPDAPGHGHNHAHGGHDHLHSHPHGDSSRERMEEIKVLAAAFVDGFRAATDKTSYLRLTGVPFHRTGTDGLTLHLVDVAIGARWQIGTASPAFAARELVYLPFPGEMVTGHETMTFTYVSLTERLDVALPDLIADRTIGPHGD